MTDKWYSPGEIRFTVRQSLWLIRNLGSLQDGHYPAEVSNYIDTGGRKSRKAPFETAADYYAEITDRLERCGIDGLILISIEAWGMSIASLSKYFNRPEWSIMRSRKTALGYVGSGPVRRWHTTKKRSGESYQDFKRRRRAN